MCTWVLVDMRACHDMSTSYVNIVLRVIVLGMIVPGVIDRHRR